MKTGGGKGMCPAWRAVEALEVGLPRGVCCDLGEPLSLLLGPLIQPNMERVGQSLSCGPRV